MEVEKDVKPLETNDPNLLQQIYEFRVQWLLEGVEPNPFPSGFWKDEHDDHARQWIVKDCERLLAVARMCVHDTLLDVPGSEAFEDLHFEVRSPIASLNRLAVHGEARGKGLSHCLDIARIDAAIALGCRSIVAFTSAGDHRIESLERKGFLTVSPRNFRSQFPFGPGAALVKYL